MRYIVEHEAKGSNKRVDLFTSATKQPAVERLQEDSVALGGTFWLVWLCDGVRSPVKFA